MCMRDMHAQCMKPAMSMGPTCMIACKPYTFTLAYNSNELRVCVAMEPTGVQLSGKCCVQPCGPNFDKRTGTLGFLQ